LNVYILVDSEGEACVVREKSETTTYGISQADLIRRQATREAAAVVKGAREAGAEDILVHDGCFIRGAVPCGLVLLYEELPPGIRIALGGDSLKNVVDSSFDAAILIGHHAMAGTQGGVMAHTFSAPSVENMWLNGKRIGEIGIEALVLGAFGIPVVMVSADEAGCQEAREWLGPIEIAPTKQGLATHAAISLHPEDACELICSRTKAALGRLQEFEPFKLDPPFELRTDCYTEEQAKARGERKNGTMVGPRSFVIKTDNPLDLI